MSDRKEGNIYIVFDGPPAPESGRFIEVEDHNGAGLRVGEWLQDRVDGEGVVHSRVLTCPACTIVLIDALIDAACARIDVVGA